MRVLQRVHGCSGIDVAHPQMGHTFNCGGTESVERGRKTPNFPFYVPFSFPFNSPVLGLNIHKPEIVVSICLSITPA